MKKLETRKIVGKGRQQTQIVTAHGWLNPLKREDLSSSTRSERLNRNAWRAACEEERVFHRF